MTRLTLGLLCLLPAFLPGSLSAGEKPLSADLAFVPPNCAGFVHFRLHDIWKSEHAREWRGSVMKAGSEALAEFDKRFFPTPSTMERFTIMFVSMNNERRFNRGADPVFIIAASRPIDKAAFLKNSAPKAREVNVKGRKYFKDDFKNMEILFIDDRTLAVSYNGLLRQVLDSPRIPRGTLTEALNVANGGKPIVMALNHDIVPGQVFYLLPPEIKPLFKFQLAFISVDFEKEGHVEVRTTYNSAAEAAAAEAGAREGIAFGRAFLDKERTAMEREIFADGQPATLDDLPKTAASLLALGLINQADDYLVKLPLQKSANALTLSLKMPEGTQTLLSSAAPGAAVGWLMNRRNNIAAPVKSAAVFPSPPVKPKEPDKK